MKTRIEFKITAFHHTWELSYDSIRVSKSGKWGTAKNGFIQIGRVAFIWHVTES